MYSTHSNSLFVNAANNDFFNEKILIMVQCNTYIATMQQKLIYTTHYLEEEVCSHIYLHKT